MPHNLHHAQEWLRQQLGPRPLAQNRWRFVSTIEDAVREADLAIDCVPDELESKLEIFCLLDRMAPPRTVLATPTTRLSIADLASCTYRPDKCVAIAARGRESCGSSKPRVQFCTTSRTSAETVGSSPILEQARIQPGLRRETASRRGCVVPDRQPSKPAAIPLV